MPDLSLTNQHVSPGLDRIIRHCLEKNPEQRFHSAHDLAFDLEALSGVSGSAPARQAAPPRSKISAAAARLIAAALALLFGGFWAGRNGLPGTSAHQPVDHVSRKRLTFRRGNVLTARFTQDAQNIVYGASWGDRPTEIFFSHVASPETRPLGIEGASLLSVSPSGELAILLKSNNLFGTGGSGTLARVPLVGGSPRRLAEKVTAADWTPDGINLVVLRDAGSKSVLEFPLGKPVYSSAALLTSLRVSPDGKRVALIGTDGSHYWIDVVDAAGNTKVLAKDFIRIDSLAWHPSGTEIWFDGVDRRPSPGLFGVSLEGSERTIATTTDLEVLHDIARDGSVLVEREISRREIFGAFGGERQERNLSWLETSSATALSNDGKEMLFWEAGEGGGKNSSVYVRGTDGAPAVRLGDGRACDLSPDGKWALTIQQVSGSTRLVLLPTGAGEPVPIPIEGIQLIWAGFFPDGNRLMIVGSDPGHGVRGYVVARSGGKPRPFTPELANGGAISPDGQLVAEEQADRRAMISTVATGSSHPIAGLDTDDVPIQWSADGAELFVTRYGEAPMPIWRLNLKSGKKELWKTLMPADRTGFDRIDEVMVTRDGASYAYSYTRVTDSDLFLVKGWK